MNRPHTRGSYEAPPGHHHPHTTAHLPSGNPMYPPPYESNSPAGSNPLPPRYDGSRRSYEQLPPLQGLQQRESHLHLPSVSTYIAHYHYYNFNGDCTIQQAASDGGPNTIRMAGAASHRMTTHMHRPQGDPPPAPNAPNIDVPPVPPPISEPLPRSRNVAPPYHYSGEVTARDPVKRAGSLTSPYSSLSMSHLAPIPGPSRPTIATSAGASSSDLGKRESSYVARDNIPPPTSSGQDSRGLPSASTSLLPHLRGPFDPGGRIALPPLQPQGMSSLRADEGNVEDMRASKRSRISRGSERPLPERDDSRGRAPGVIDSRPDGHNRDGHRRAHSHAQSALPGPQSGPPRYGLEHAGHNASNGSPPRAEYQVPGGRGSAMEVNDHMMPQGGMRARTSDETQVNDWEAVVDMYNTGRGTEDGVALKMITKGDGRRVSDRKLLEKRRTIGKTHETLGAERFEAAIGYKWENGARRKQKMYHVISRCRVVNAMRKANETIPVDHGELTAIIDERIAQKEALKEAGKTQGPAGNNGAGGGTGTGQGRGAEGGYAAMGAPPSHSPGTGSAPTSSGIGGGSSSRNGRAEMGEDEEERSGSRERERGRST